MSERTPERASAADYAARLCDITKSFSDVAAVRNVTFHLRAGEIHALLGENGAGKSTLCSVLAGLYRPDAGVVEVAGIPRHFHSPHDALEAGIGMVYQHFRLVRQLTVAENLALGRRDIPRRLSRRALEEHAAQLADEFKIEVDPRAAVSDLSVGQQQRVEILRLLGRGVRVLILDEPTAVLTTQEADRLFEAVDSLTANGTSVVLVTHKLNEIQSVAQRVTVLSQGIHVATVTPGQADKQTLARMMVSRDTDAEAEDVLEQSEQATSDPHPPETESRPIALAVAGLRVAGDDGRHVVADVDLDVRSGEILGVAGVSGNGQRELADAIAGLRVVAAGSVEIAGQDVTDASVRERTAGGLGYVPEDRLGQGVAAGLTLEDNLILRRYWDSRFRRGPFFSRKAVTRWIAARRESVEIRGARPGVRVGVLSGGNIQRVILARELGDDTKVLVACSPTRGLDVGAIALIHGLLREQRDRGLGVLLISEDLDEVLALSNRVAVMYEGRVVGLVDAIDADRAQLGLLMAGAVSP